MKRNLAMVGVMGALLGSGAAFGDSATRSVFVPPGGSAVVNGGYVQVIAGPRGTRILAPDNETRIQVQGRTVTTGSGFPGVWAKPNGRGETVPTADSTRGGL